MAVVATREARSAATGRGGQSITRTAKQQRQDAKRKADLNNYVPPPTVTYTNCGNVGCGQRTPTKSRKPPGWMNKNYRFWACWLPVMFASNIRLDTIDVKTTTSNFTYR